MLKRERLLEADPCVFYNLWWYSARFSLPLPLPTEPESTESPSHLCALVAWDRTVALHGCRAAARRIAETLGKMEGTPDGGTSSKRYLPDSNEPVDGNCDGHALLSSLTMQDLSGQDWDDPDLSSILVGLVAACDKREFSDVMVRVMKATARLETPESQKEHRIDPYQTLLYLAKYQCTSAFHSFFPAVVKPCKGYHFWCAFGAPLPVFDRLFREAASSYGNDSHSSNVVPFASDMALGFRCVFGHLV